MLNLKLKQIYIYIFFYQTRDWSGEVAGVCITRAIMLRKPSYCGGVYGFFYDSTMAFLSGIRIVLTGDFLMRWRVMMFILRFGSDHSLFFSFFSHLFSLISLVFVSDLLQNSKVTYHIFLTSSWVSIISIAIFNNNYNLIL
jgi:hypothetical protein